MLGTREEGPISRWMDEGRWLRWKDGKGYVNVVHETEERAQGEGIWMRWKGGKGKVFIIFGHFSGSGFCHDYGWYIFSLQRYDSCWNKQFRDD